MSLKLASVNIERSKHLPLVETFFQNTEADVLCVQELMQEDVERLSKVLHNTPCIFVPMGIREGEEPSRVMGIGIFSRVPVQREEVYYYVGSKHEELRLSNSQDASTFNNFHRPVVAVDVEKAGILYRVVTTHFTWTPDGQADDVQREDLARLFSILDGLKEFVLCGDFNAPRGREIFDTIAGKYRDNIPPVYTTSIDSTIHRAGKLDLMVDGLFTTPAYAARDVVLHSGVSDHCAVTATIEKN